MADYGVTDEGFVPLSLSEIQDDLQSALQQAFGGTAVDLSSQSFLGQLTGIIANANADLWAMGQALYANSYPAGATGVAVDNILALNNQQRLTAKATVTNPSAAVDDNGQVLYGLVLRGTQGTVVPAGTQFSNGASTPAVFTLDRAATIAPASNAQQVLYMTNVPTSGSYTLTLLTSSGDAFTTSAIPYNADLNATKLTYNSGNTGFPSTWNVFINGQKSADIFSGGIAHFGPNTYQVAPMTADRVQAAIRSIPGYSAVTVTGTVTDGFSINWNSASAGVVTVSGDSCPDNVLPSVSSYITNVANSAGVKPFTDVALVPQAQNILFIFGQNAVQQGQPPTASQSIPLLKVASSTLARGGSSTLLSVVSKVTGSPAQAPASATCTRTGEVVVLAGQLNTIVNPVSGLDSVTNQLDCLTGRDAETDAQAMARLTSQQGVAASGSLAAITARIKALDGVTQAVGFQNTSNAAQQVIQFASAPTTGSFNLFLGGQATTLLPYNAQASDVQAAIAALNGFSATRVNKYGDTGFLIEFAGAAAKQAQALCQFPVNTTSVALAAFFGRGAHAVELVVQGGDDGDVAEAILETLPAGIGTYSNPALRTTTALTAGSPMIAPTRTSGVAIGQSIEAAGVPVGTTVANLSNGVITMSRSATTTASSVGISFDHGSLVTDAQGNQILISFSRPATTLIYCEVDLVTDLYNTPGDDTSGRNSAAKFSLDQVAIIQNNLIALVNAVPIGGTIVANGSNSLGGSFRNVPGVLNYTLKFDRVSPPVNQANLALNTNEAPLAESYTIAVNVS